MYSLQQNFQEPTKWSVDNTEVSFDARQIRMPRKILQTGEIAVCTMTYKEASAVKIL